MAKFFSLVLAVSLSLAPSVAFAGVVDGCDKIGPNWNATTGSSGLWFFNSSAGTSSGVDQQAGSTTGSGPLPELLTNAFELLGDSVMGYPDLNGDGITDHIQVDPSTGFTYARIMQSDGSNWVSVAEEGALPGLLTTDFAWVGLPDLNGDGKTDLCQIHDTGFTYCYLMDGLTATGFGQISGPITVDFRIIAFTDMDNTGTDDVVIQSSDGFTYTYLQETDGGNFVQDLAAGATGSLITMAFETIGFPDLNGDNKSDVVIQDPSTGFTYAFLQNGVTEIAQGAISGLITTDFATLGFPDLNADGFADHVTIHPASGFTYAFLQEPDGGTFVQEQAQGEVPPVKTGAFELRGFPDLDCDGDADVTYQDPSNGFTIANLSGDSGFIGDSTEVVLDSAPAGSVTRDWAQSWAVLADPFAP